MRLYRGMRRKSGMGTIELAMTAVGGVIFCCIAVDMGLMMLGNQMLDRATRDAARAAAGQQTQLLAQQAAQAALKNHKADGFWVTTPTLDVANFVYFDNNGTPDGQIIPPTFPNAGKKAGVQTAPAHVEVTASTVVNLPANLTMFSGTISMLSGPLASGKMTFKRTYYFPIVRSALNNAFQ